MTDLQRLRQLSDDFARAADPSAQPQTAAGIARLRALRLQLIEGLLETREPAERLAEVLGTAAGVCSRMGLRTLRRSPAEEALLTRCLESMLVNLPVAGLAAFLLVGHASDLQFVPVLASIPPHLRPLWAQFLFEMPAAFARHGDAERLVSYAQQLCDRVTTYLSSAATPTGDVVAAAFMRSSLFMQCYFNELNLREVMRSRAAIIEHILESSGSVLDQLRVVRRLRRRPRVGVVTLSLADGTETVFLAAHLERLDRSRYETRLYSLAEPDGPVGQLCRASVDSYLQLPADVSAAVARLRAEDLDVALFTTNITACAHPLAQIAAHRVASLQGCNGASPVTTGHRNIDFLISGEVNEAADSQSHYTEELLLIPGAANCYPFHYLIESQAEPATPSRAQLSIPDGVPLFFSSANFFKILPELSEAWMQILKAVPHSHLLLMPFNPNWSSSYQWQGLGQRLSAQAAEAGVAPERIRLHTAVPTVREMQAIMKLADVYLDAFPFTGACSLYDPLDVGMPVVARSGRVCRSRHSAAMLGQIDASDWVAGDRETYVRRAIELGIDPERRRADRERIALARRRGFKFADTTDYAARLMPVLDDFFARWDGKVEALHARAPAELTDTIARFARAVGARRPSFTDLDLVTEIVLPYLGNRGSRRLLDIGACVGGMTKPFLQLGWQAVMFEPDTRCHPTLLALLQNHPGQAQLEKAAATPDSNGSIRFHVATLPGLSGLSRSPFAQDLSIVEVDALAVAPYIDAHRLFDLDFIKIDAEGQDFLILRGIDFAAVSPRLVMVEFGEQFAGQDCAGITAELAYMRERDYRACVVCLSAKGRFDQHDWRTRLAAIGIDTIPEELPEGPVFGNVLFFRADDTEFLPSLCDYLERGGTLRESRRGKA